MKILYGVVGEGMGHAIRSAVVVEHLASLGHQVEIVASARAVEYLKARCGHVRPIHGLHIVTRDQKVDEWGTLISNLRRGVAALPGQIAAYFRLISEFRPELVISDFESWSYVYAKVHGVPIISLDNQQFIHRCEHPDEIVGARRGAFRLARAGVKAKVPGCDRYIITSFAQAPVRKPRTTLVPPIVRPEITGATGITSAATGHLLVYQTIAGDHALEKALRDTGVEVRIYGLRGQLDADQREGSLLYRPFSPTGFVEDLATCSGVIASAGHTLMSECVALGKPMLAIPLEGQFEQYFNARYLEQLGYGHCSRRADPQSIADFVAARETLSAAFAGRRQRDNAQAFAQLSRDIAELS